MQLRVYVHVKALMVRGCYGNGEMLLCGWALAGLCAVTRESVIEIDLPAAPELELFFVLSYQRQHEVPQVVGDQAPSSSYYSFFFLRYSL